MQPSARSERFHHVMNSSSNCTYLPDREPSLFEDWLQSDLQRLYERTLREPVPDELLQMILREPDPTRF